MTVHCPFFVNFCILFSLFVPIIRPHSLLHLLFFSINYLYHHPHHPHHILLHHLFNSVFFTDLEPLKLAPGTSFHEYETKQKRKREGGKVDKNVGNEFSTSDSSIPEKKVLACVNNTESSADFLKNLLNEQNIPTSETKGKNSSDNSINVIDNNTNDNYNNNNSNYSNGNTNNGNTFQNNVHSYYNNNLNHIVRNNVNNNYYDDINNSSGNRNGNNIDIHNNRNSNNINKYLNNNTTSNSSSSSHNNIHNHNINNYNNNINSYNNSNNEANTANRINKITQSSDSILSSYGGAVVLPIHGQVGQAGSTGQNFQPPKFPYNQNTVPPPPFLPPPNLRDTRYAPNVSGQAQGSGKSVHPRSQEFVSRLDNQGKYNQ